MTSERKIETNRRNAKKSTGPRTKLGKARSRMNAFRHGITAEHVILDGESAKQFNAFRRKLFEAFAPADAIEAELVQAIVMEQWRLRRHYRAEASLFTELGGGKNLGGGFQAAPQSLTTLIRYHAGIERSIHRNMAALERLQARQRGEAVQAPIVVDTIGPNDTEQNDAPVLPIASAKAPRSVGEGPDVPLPASEARS
jgi:hypothetical protein